FDVRLPQPRAADSPPAPGHPRATARARSRPAPHPDQEVRRMSRIRSRRRTRLRRARRAGVLAVLVLARPGAAQQADPAPREIRIDPDRAVQLYVSNDPADHDLGRDHERDRRMKAWTDSIFRIPAPGPDAFREIAYADGVRERRAP